MAADDGGLFPVAVLIDELKSNELAVRVRATKQLKVIAEALGINRTRDELVPYITEKGGGWDDDDEVLICIAEQFADFLDYVGGPDHAEVLLGPLEQLVGMEEPGVRDQAVKALKAIVGQLPDKVVDREYTPIVLRMAKHEWAACKAGAVALIPQLYSRVRSPDLREQLHNLFCSLCGGQEPMVKRAAAQNMSELCKYVKEPNLLPALLQHNTMLARDKQDGVRLLVIEKAADVAKELASVPHFIQSHIVPLVKEAAQDPSWRVRYMLCSNFKATADATGLSQQPAELAKLFRDLSEDDEVEVRTAAAHQISTVGALLSGTRELATVVESFKSLCNNSNHHVRAAAAANIVGLSKVFSRGEIQQVSLVPLLKNLLEDESSEVRLNVIGELGKVSDSVGFKDLSSQIMPAVTALATDPKWRVREGVINVVPSLAKLMGTEIFDAELSKIVVGWLTDQVCEIRTLVAKVLCDLWATFGEQWARTNLLPKVLVLANKDNYMHRVALLNFLACCAKNASCSAELLNTTFLNLFNSMARDKVPNVRFNVAKAIDAALPKLDAATISSNWRPLLDALENDSDNDVRHFARKALVNCP
ncbi:Serine/threonine-protein phosphatase 2A regulatory subunit pppA [Diplonema papillatum]|nr:Serine/threonine-protein phosphatase 2A regulatory subunit pppA [Diplonema papillatum]